MRTALAAIGLLALGGCATTPLSGPVDVLRYHLDGPLAKGTVAVQPLSAADEVSVDYRAYANAVQSELAAVGYAPAASSQAAEFLATVSFRREGRGLVERQSPVSVGIGGGSFGGGRRGGGVGVGGGVNFPIGRGQTSEIVATELSVQLRGKGAAGSVIWEGKASTQADERAPDARHEVAAGKLARALFSGFPGESGRTITVK